MGGDIFCEHFASSSAYIRFCSSQQTSSLVLQTCAQSNAAFNSYLLTLQAHASQQATPLSYYLLKPVKRVTEYPLLMEKLVKKTDEQHPDYLCMIEALARAKTLCDQVNEGMREKENTEKLEWLQTHVDLQATDTGRRNSRYMGEDITFNSLTHCLGPRRFVHCGVLKKIKSEKQLIGFLFNDFLLLTTGSKVLESEEQFSFHHHSDLQLKLYREPLFLQNLQISTSEDKSGFSIKFQDIQLDLEALNVNDRTLWLNKLREAIQSFKQTETAFNDNKQKVESVSMKESMGRLMLIVMKADKLSRPASKSGVEAYCEVSLGFQEHKTGVVSGENPHWNTNMQFLLKDVQKEILCITVHHKGIFSPNEFLGRQELRLNEISEECQQNMAPITRNLKLLEAESGSVTIKLHIQYFN